MKGGGHSYKGTSNSAHSLLIWTRHMNGIALHDAFVGEGCAGKVEPAQAVTVAAGATWGHVVTSQTLRRRAPMRVRSRGAMDEIRKMIPRAGSYAAESDYFEEEWQKSFWGPNYPKLLAVKDKYDPGGLFFAHHGVGSERWSADGFPRLV